MVPAPALDRQARFAALRPGGDRRPRHGPDLIQVVTRYFLGESIFGIEEGASFLAIFLYFIGGAYGAYERGHISASLVDLIVPGDRARQAIETFTGALTVILSGWMTVWASSYFLLSLQRGPMSLELGIQMAWVHAAIPLGLVLMTFYFAVELLEGLASLRLEARR